jgi:phytoene dehydrogenase-like protein
VRATNPDGEEHRIEASAVLSNAGPRNTARLVRGTSAETAFAERVRGTEPTAMLALAFSTSHDILPETPGFLNFTGTQRLCTLAHLSATCPDLAPPGRTLIEAYSVPRPGIGERYDLAQERRLLEDDLRKHLQGFESAEIIHFKAMSGEEHPAHQMAPGQDPGVRTPIANLMDVGDGVKPPGWIGTTACALTGRLAAEALLHDTAVA